VVSGYGYKNQIINIIRHTNGGIIVFHVKRLQYISVYIVNNNFSCFTVFTFYNDFITVFVVKNRGSGHFVFFFFNSCGKQVTGLVIGVLIYKGIVFVLAQKFS